MALRCFPLWLILTLGSAQVCTRAAEVSVYASVPDPEEMAFDSLGYLYAGSGDATSLYRIPPGGGEAEVWGGNAFEDSDGIDVDADGNAWGTTGLVCSKKAGEVVRILANGQVFSIGSNYLRNPTALEVDRAGRFGAAGAILVADQWCSMWGQQGQEIFRIVPQEAGQAEVKSLFKTESYIVIRDLCFDAAGTLWFIGGGRLYQWPPGGSVRPVSVTGITQGLAGMCFDAKTNTLLLAASSQRSVVRVALDGQVVESIAEGVDPRSVALDSQGNVYISDRVADVIWVAGGGDCTIHGHIGYEDDGQPGDVAGIPVCVYQEGVAEPVWEGLSDPDGRFQVESFLSSYDPDGPQRFHVEAKWENDVVVVKDYLTKEVVKMVSEVKSCASPGGNDFDLVFSDATLVRDAQFAFADVNEAWGTALKIFGHKTAKQSVFLNADDAISHLAQYCSGCLLETKPWDWVRNRGKYPQGLYFLGEIYKGPGEESGRIETVWHEFAHACHADLIVDEGGLLDCMAWGMTEDYMAEGFAEYFVQVAGKRASGDGNVLWRANSWEAMRTIFWDIHDGVKLEELDFLDGPSIDGDRKLYEVIRLNEPKNIFEFRDAFVGKYPELKTALDLILAAHKVPGYDQRSLAAVGALGQGQTGVHGVTADSTVLKIRFQLEWSGSDLDLTLTSPAGRVIDPVSVAGDPNITYVEEQAQEYYVIENPEPGLWQMHITAVDVPPEGEQYTATAELTTNLILSLSTDKERYDTNEPITVTAELFQDANSCPDASVVAQIQTPTGSQTLPLFDDGLHNDVNSRDGIYANTLTSTSAQGQYGIIATASGQNAFAEPFVRETHKTVVVQNLPDLVPLHLIMDPGPVPGEVRLTALVSNSGTRDANDILVAFYDANDANTVPIGDYVTIDHLGPGQAREVSVIWAVSGGVQNVFVAVDYWDAIVEVDEANNYLKRTFCIGWGAEGDLNHDCLVNLLDLAELANKWLHPCSEPDWCGGADLDRDGKADYMDLSAIAGQWLSSL